jgi:hypothetical protein
VEFLKWESDLTEVVIGAAFEVANAIWGSSSPWAASTPGAELISVAINGDN